MKLTESVATQKSAHNQPYKWYDTGARLEKASLKKLLFITYFDICV